MSWHYCVVVLATLTTLVQAGYSNPSNNSSTRSYLDAARRWNSLDDINNSSNQNSSSGLPQSRPYLSALQRSASATSVEKPSRRSGDGDSNGNSNSNSNSNNSRNNKHIRRGSSQSRNGGCQTNYDFDHIQLTLQWTPGTCLTSPQACQKVAPQFSIHGMWLNSRFGEGPSFCCFDNQFNFQELSPLIKDMDLYWFSLYSSSSRGFWSHEWLKHGTCARDVPALNGERNYFGTTLDIFKKLRVYDNLMAANIAPTKNKPYQTVEISSALKKISQGREIQVDCDLDHQQPIPVLKGVNFCFDRSLQFTDCPPMKKRCRGQVLFLPS